MHWESKANIVDVFCLLQKSWLVERHKIKFTWSTEMSNFCIKLFFMKSLRTSTLLLLLYLFLFFKTKIYKVPCHTEKHDLRI